MGALDSSLPPIRHDPHAPPSAHETPVQIFSTVWPLDRQPPASPLALASCQSTLQYSSFLFGARASGVRPANVEGQRLARSHKWKQNNVKTPFRGRARAPGAPSGESDQIGPDRPALIGPCGGAVAPESQRSVSHEAQGRSTRTMARRTTPGGQQGKNGIPIRGSKIASSALARRARAEARPRSQDYLLQLIIIILSPSSVPAGQHPLQSAPD